MGKVDIRIRCRGTSECIEGQGSVDIRIRCGGGSEYIERRPGSVDIRIRCRGSSGCIRDSVDIRIRCGGGSKYIKDRLVTTVFAFEETLDKSLVDVAKKVLDRLVLHNRPFRSYGTLKDTNTLGILIKDGLDVFCSP